MKNLREPNWDAFIRIYKTLSKSEKEVANFYQIDQEYMLWAGFIRPKLPSFINERSDPANFNKLPGSEDVDFAMCLVEKMNEADFKLVKYCRFYMALMANEILKETNM